MKGWDDFEEVGPIPGPPIEEDDKPAVGSAIDGRIVKRVKAVKGMCPAMVEILTLRSDSLSPDLLLVQHPRRPFVFWLAELGEKSP